MSLTGIGLAVGKGLVTGAAIGAVGELTPVVGGIIGSASSAGSNLVDQAVSGQKINPGQLIEHGVIGLGVGAFVPNVSNSLTSDVGSELFYNDGTAFPGSTLPEQLNGIEKEAIGAALNTADDITNDVFSRIFDN